MMGVVWKVYKEAIGVFINFFNLKIIDRAEPTCILRGSFQYLYDNLQTDKTVTPGTIHVSPQDGGSFTVIWTSEFGSLEEDTFCKRPKTGNCCLVIFGPC